MQNQGDHDSAARESELYDKKIKMMIIGDPLRSSHTVHIPSWGHQNLEDPATHLHSPISHTSVSPDTSPYDAALAALQRYLPSNKDDVLQTGGEDSDDFDLPVDAFSCDNFRMYEFKVKRCARARSHDWTECPFAHPGEKARRRDPRKYHYSGNACPDFRKGACKRGDACEYAHGVFECWLHPARYRTQPCKDGTHCRRRVCFFAHTPEQLRVLPYTSSPDESPLGLGPESFFLMGSSPKPTLYSPPSSPSIGSPPVSPNGSLRLGQLTESMRGLQINKIKMGMGIGLSMSPPSWCIGSGSPRTQSPARPGFMSLPSTPIRSATQSGLSAFDVWETSRGEEPAMERVESGKALREKIYAKLGRENSLDRVGSRTDSASSVPDVEWVSELVN